MVVDEFARRLGIDRWKTKDGARQAYDSARGLVLVEPQTFMNNSGVPVRIVASWYRVPPEDMLVVYDDMDIPFGKLRLRASGGHGGHNGMRSIIATMDENFARLRIGAGPPRIREHRSRPNAIYRRTAGAFARNRFSRDRRRDVLVRKRN